MFQEGYGYPKTTQVVSYDGSTLTANAVGAHIHCVRLLATTDCHVIFTTSGSATTNDMMLQADVPEYFVIHPGQKVAAIKAVTAGVLNVTEMTR